MKNNLIVLILAALISFTACTDNDSSNPIQKTNVDKPNTPMTSDPSNPNNPYDYAGQLHNACLDYLATNTLSIDNEGFKQDMITYITNYYVANNITYDIPSGTTIQDYVSSNVNTFFDTQMGTDINVLLNTYGVSNNTIVLANDLKNMIAQITLLDSSLINEQVFTNKINEIKSWENMIVLSPYTDQEKKQILSMSAICRYSIYYWYNVYQNPNSPWHSCWEIGTIVNKMNKDNPQTFNYQNMPWWYKVACTAVADGIGGYTAGPVGGVVYSSAMACVMWADDIWNGIKWLGNTIWDGLTAAWDWVF